MITLVTKEYLDSLSEERKNLEKLKEEILKKLDAVNDTLIYYIRLMLNDQLAIVNESNYEQKKRELEFGQTITANNGCFKADVV
jgi:metal-sulfur cluster biosynthetic enzyme